MEKTKEKVINNINNEEGGVIQEMYENGAHFGYKRSKRHPSISSYIYGLKNNTEIFDLERTSSLFEDALKFIKKMGEENKVVLFVGGKHESWDAVRESAELANMPYAIGRWIGGTITNFKEIKKRVKRLTELKEQKEAGEFVKKYTKKERLLIDREIKDLEDKFGGIEQMPNIPDVIYVVDPKSEEIAVREALGKKVSIVALANSDCDISEIDYPIPANDSARSSIKYFTGKVVEAYIEGTKKPKEEKNTEEEKKTK